MGTLILLLAILIGFAIFKYNSLQGKAQAIRRQLSNVQVAISKKLSLINQLIDTVKNYQEGEQLVQLKVSQDNTSAAMMNAYSQSGTTLASIQGMMERFPNLKANEQYQTLMKNIEACETDIQQQRTAYNAVVEAYNVQRLRIPTIFIARFIGFSEAPYLEFDLSGANDVTSLKEFKTDDGERLTQLLNSAGKNIAGATKSIANHAGNAGKLIADKIKEKQESKYFYMLPGSTPKGPLSKDELQQLITQNQISAETLFNRSGTDEWVDMSTMLSTTPGPESLNHNHDNRSSI